ncbi:MAG: helix-turn-helix transcriptional regulator [Armatimonadetes bacterium]|nr:helix-turn-helix transcriptional regulator [Armatimonadota bacterium]
MDADAARDGVCETHYVDQERVNVVAERMLPGFVFAGLAETFQALGDPTRVKILFALSQAELCVCDVAALLGVSVSAVSHQLRTLRSLRIVRPRRKGRRVYYSLDDEHVRTLFDQALEHLGHRVSDADERKGEEVGGDEELAAAGAAARR